MAIPPISPSLQPENLPPQDLANQFSDAITTFARVIKNLTYTNASNPQFLKSVSQQILNLHALAIQAQTTEK